MSEENKTEIWRTYPEIDFIKVSNLGRIRTLDRVVATKRGTRTVKGRILAQAKNNKGYLRTGINTNGKQVFKYVHRLVAETFLPNPNNLPEVNHIDNNPLNNNVSNLEWCTHEYNVQYKEKYGTSSAEALGKPLWVFDLKTGDKSYFNTQREAERKTGVDYKIINMIIKGRCSQAGGYYFTEDENKVTKERLQAIKANMHYLNGVIAVNLKTQEVLRFKSRKEAAKSLGCDAGNIGGVIKGRLKQTHGYWFVHVDENTAEKTKAKFGNSIANKVAKSIECFCKE